MSSASGPDWLAQRFEANRPHLRAVAVRMLGSAAEADDALQEAWIKVSHADADGVENIAGWLRTVVARVALDMLRSRRARREESFGMGTSERATSAEIDPEAEAILAESIGEALLIVLDRLAPNERLAFVLHDMFDVPFNEVAAIVGRSPAAARQLASRARRRVQGKGSDRPADGLVHAKLIDAFLGAARRGNLHALLEILDPNVVVRPDQTAVAMGAQESRGADSVAAWFSGRAAGAQVALVDGRAGAVWMPGGELRVVFKFITRGDKITQIQLVAEPDRIRQIDLVLPG